MKPCPFCSGRDIHVAIIKGTRARCAGCGATGPYAEKPSEALAAWKRRPTPTAPQGMREALENIDRMKVLPEDKMNRLTLAAAISIARTALSLLEGGGSGKD